MQSLKFFIKLYFSNASLFLLLSFHNMILNAEFLIKREFHYLMCNFFKESQMAVFLRSQRWVFVFHEEPGQQPLKSLLHNETTLICKSNVFKSSMLSCLSVFISFLIESLFSNLLEKYATQNDKIHIIIFLNFAKTNSKLTNHSILLKIIKST